MVIRCKVNLKKSVVFSAFLCSVLFLFISISNTTYSLDLAANEECPEGYSELTNDDSYKCYKKVSNKENISEFNSLSHICTNDMNGEYFTIDASDGEIFGVCKTNKTVVIKKVNLFANKGIFTSIGDGSLHQNLIFDVKENDGESKFTLSYNKSIYNLSRKGYNFIGWSDDAGNNGMCTKKYSYGESIDNPGINYYACWDPSKASITLNANGGYFSRNGVGNLDNYNFEVIYDDKVSGYEFSLNYYDKFYQLKRDGYTLIGWSTDKGFGDSCIPKYVSGEKIVVDNDEVYYACWSKNDTTDPDEGGSSSGSPNITCSSNSIGLWCTDSNTSGGVSSLQTKLKYLGYYSGSIDGSAGPQTVEAIKSFQQKEGLTVDGNAGPATLEKLRLRYNEKITDTDDQETIPDDEEVETNPLSYYTVTFELDGGTFSNGDTNRKMVVSSEAILNPLPYNPTKAGYKFIGWYNSDNEKYEFYKNVSSNITLFAKWEKYSDDENCTYSCNSGDVFDPSTNKCIAVEKFSNNSTLISEVNYTKNCVNELLNYTDYSCSGNCNKENCSSAYTSNLWYENNNCKFGSSCTSSDNGSCSITMKKECYKLYEPKTDCDSNLPPETPDTNSPTFDLPIAIVWIVGGSALIFAIIYLRKYYNSQRV